MRQNTRLPMIYKTVCLLLCLLFGSSICGCAAQPPSGETASQSSAVQTESSSSAPSQTETSSHPDAASSQPASQSDTEKEDIDQQPDTDKTDPFLQQLLDSMSLEEKVGQMFIVRCPQQNAADIAQQYHLGGYILFARDFESNDPQLVTSNIQQYQEVSDIPMLIGVDEEGGTVNRVSKYPAFRETPFQSPQALYDLGGLELIESDTIEKSQLLLSLGINVNFAPVCDVSQNPDDFIYDRAFGGDAVQTAEYVKTVVCAMKQEGIGSVLKHFPGYGNNLDTHTGIAYDDRSFDTFADSDFIPFQAGIDAGADIVLVSHNIVNCMDSENPASLSENVHQILRNRLGFDGVIVTDDLSMDGIRDFTDDQQAAVLAVQAGNDLICCTDYQTQIPAVIQAANSGEISEEIIDQAVLRILKMKQSLGLLRRDLSRIYFVYQNAMNRVKNKTSLFHCKKHLERSGSKCFFLLCPSKPHLASLLPTLNLQNLPNRSI